MSKEETKKVPSYGVYILRKDDQHIELLVSNNYDECFDRYKEIKDRWAQSIKDKTPFELERPIVTAFDPGLVYEITLRLITETPSSRNENPYQKQMEKNGLGNMFSRTAQVGLSGDLLDGGYR